MSMRTWDGYNREVQASSYLVTSLNNSTTVRVEGAIGYSWFDGLLRNPWSGVQTPQVLGYSGLRVAEPLVRG